MLSISNVIIASRLSYVYACADSGNLCYASDILHVFYIFAFLGSLCMNPTEANLPEIFPQTILAVCT